MPAGLPVRRMPAGLHVSKHMSRQPLVAGLTPTRSARSRADHPTSNPVVTNADGTTTTVNRQVAGSNPAGSAIHGPVAQWIERDRPSRRKARQAGAFRHSCRHDRPHCGDECRRDYTGEGLRAEGFNSLPHRQCRRGSLANLVIPAHRQRGLQVERDECTGNSICRGFETRRDVHRFRSSVGRAMVSSPLVVTTDHPGPGRMLAGLQGEHLSTHWPVQMRFI